MKRISFIVMAFILSFPALGQRTVKMKNLWAEPQVHVLFNGYTVSFTVKDINRALQLLAETGDSSYGLSCGLDSAANIAVELGSGNHIEYQNALQPLLQNGVGVFLLSVGHAYIENPKRRTVHEVTMDTQPTAPGVDDMLVYFYDPKTNKMLFSGRMAADLYHKDLGIDY